jgi:hypothetical protein
VAHCLSRPRATNENRQERTSGYSEFNLMLPVACATVLRINSRHVQAPMCILWHPQQPQHKKVNLTTLQYGLVCGIIHQHHS